MSFEPKEPLRDSSGVPTWKHIIGKLHFQIKLSTNQLTSNRERICQGVDILNIDYPNQGDDNQTPNRKDIKSSIINSFQREEDKQHFLKIAHKCTRSGRQFPNQTTLARHVDYSANQNQREPKVWNLH